MQVKVKKLNSYDRDLTVAGDKSITHRAIMFNAVLNGSATVTNALLGADCLSTIRCAERMGAEIFTVGDTLYINGTEKLRSATLDVGNSGTTIRLMSGLLCGFDGEYTLFGDSSIAKRPMSRVIEPLKLMGADIDSNGGYAPIKINGTKLNGIEYVMPVASAQVKSAILLAGLKASGVTRVIEKNPSRDHTERMLKAMGADITSENGVITVKASKLYPTDVRVPSDISSAAFPMVIAAGIRGSRAVIGNVGVNPTRTGILEVFKRAGVKYELTDCRTECGEPIANITVYGGQINAFDIDADIIPRLIDEIPVLAVLASLSNGKCVISGAEELKVKESNRIRATVDMLLSMGVKVTETDDGMIIYGNGEIVGGATVDPKGDHRIAMSAAVAGALSDKGVTVLDAECADVSFPNFYSCVLGVNG